MTGKKTNDGSCCDNCLSFNHNNDNYNDDDDNNNNNNNNHYNNDNHHHHHNHHYHHNRTERCKSRFFFTISLLHREQSPTRKLKWHTSMPPGARVKRGSYHKKKTTTRTYLCPSLPVERSPPPPPPLPPSPLPHHRTLFWAALVIPDQLVPCCFSSASVSRLQLLRGRPLFLFPCGFQVRAYSCSLVIYLLLTHVLLCYLC